MDNRDNAYNGHSGKNEGNRYDCIIIGAGISGLLSALVLSKHGKRVLVIERSQYVGGNCRSYKVDGFTVDTGPHAITHLKKGPLKVLMDNYFDYIPALVPYGTYYLRTPKGLQTIPSTVHEFATFDILPKMDRVSLIQAITKSMTLSALGTDIESESVYDWLPPNLSKDSYDFVDAMAYLLSGKSMQETSVGRMLGGSSFVRDDVLNSLDGFNNGNHTSKIEVGLVRQLQEKITNISRLVTNDVCYSQAYPKDGLRGMLNAVLYSLPDRVEIISGTAVEEIHTKDGKAYGVSTKDDTYYADFIIHSGFAKNLPDMVDDLPTSYVNDLGRIDQTTSLTIWLGLDQELPEFDYMGSEVWYKDRPYWAMPISNYNRDLAPQGKQLVGFMFALDDENNRKRDRALSYDVIHEVFPDIDKHIVMQHEQITIPEKAAVTIKGYIPEIRTPIKDLYLVGTDTVKQSMGITKAGYSVLNLMKMLDEDGKMKHI